MAARVPGLSEIFKYVNADELMEGTVQTGYEDERWVEITEGLTGEERIILQDHQRIRPGDRVTVREATN